MYTENVKTTWIRYTDESSHGYRWGGEEERRRIERGRGRGRGEEKVKT